MDSLALAIRQTRTFYVTFILSVMLYPVVGHFVSTSRTEPFDPDLAWAVRPIFVPIAVALLGVVFIIRTRMGRPAEEILRTRPKDAEALNRWRSSAILSATFTEVVGLLGLILQFFGAPWTLAAAFYVAAFLTLLVLFPRSNLTS